MNRSFLFVPGNSPKMMLNSDFLGADAIIFDLEDAVSPAEKDAARILVRNGLRALTFTHSQTVVRINSLDTPYWQRDLDEILQCRPQMIILPKTNGPEDILTLDQYMSEAESSLALPANGIRVIALIETALGLENAFSIAGASKRVAALFLGAEDLTADLQCKRTAASEEIRYARGRLVCAARAAGVEAYDTPFTAVADTDGLRMDAAMAKSMGFTGKMAIYPAHIPVINAAFYPAPEEQAHAEAVLQAIRAAEAQGIGVAVVNGKMVDAPVIKRARQVIETVRQGAKGWW